MRSLLSTIGSRGDVQPLVALALELRALGEEVRLCVPARLRPRPQGGVATMRVNSPLQKHTVRLRGLQ